MWVLLLLSLLKSLVLIEPAWHIVFVSVSLQQSGWRLQRARKCIVQPEILLWGIQLLHQGHRWVKLRPIMTYWGCQGSSQQLVYVNFLVRLLVQWDFFFFFCPQDACPKNASYYGNRAATLMMLSRFREALEDSQQAVRLDECFMKVSFQPTRT